LVTTLKTKKVQTPRRVAKAPGPNLRKKNPMGRRKRLPKKKTGFGAGMLDRDKKCL